MSDESAAKRMSDEGAAKRVGDEGAAKRVGDEGAAKRVGAKDPSSSIGLITPNGWPRGSGYAHGVLASGRILCVSGQIGWDPATRVLASTDLAAQAAQAVANVAAVLDAAGASPADVVRMTWYITDRAAYIASQKAIGAAYRRVFGGHYPAMAVVFVSALLEEGALVEIEATAVF